MYEGETLWLIRHDEKTGFWKSRIRLDRSAAIGCGSPLALAATDMCAAAAETIEVTKMRDTCTGGLVRPLVIQGSSVQ